MRRTLSWIALVALLGGLLLSGCQDDPQAPQTGTLWIDAEPDSLDAPWRLAGPDGFASAGQGDLVLASLTAGDYTVTWAAVPGWDTPDPAEVTQTLAGRGLVTFTGTYTASAGSITVDAEPDSIDAPWQLEGPGGFSRSGRGDAVVGGLSAGEYTLSWGAADSYALPDPAIVTRALVAGGTATIAGDYAPITGSLVVDPQPSDLNAPWQVAGPYGFSRDGAGQRTLADVLVGAYTVSWGAVSGYEAPAEAHETVVAGQTLTVTGNYVYLGLPFPDSADQLMANFRAIYEGMDFEDFRAMIHPEFLTILQQSTINEFPDMGPTLDAAEELRIHERMFSTQDVTDPLGQLVPGIQAVQLETFVRQGAWTPSPANDPIPNAETALYDVAFLFDRGQANSRVQVQGGIKFYVTHRDSTVGGVTRPCYRMLGQMDLTSSAQAAPGVLTPGPAARRQGADEFGVYFDEAGTVNCIREQPFAPVTAYLLLTSPAGATDGFECTVTRSGGPHLVLSTALPPGCVDVDASADGFAAGAGTPFVPDGSGALVLCTWTIMMQSSASLSFYIGPATIPSMPGGLPVVTGNGVLRRCGISSGSVDLPVAAVNGECYSSEMLSYGALKCLYR